MKTATFTDFRQKMKEHLDELESDQDILILSGPKKKDFVVLTLDIFNSMEETVHLMSTQANAERLFESIAQDKAGKLTVRRLDLCDETLTKSPRRKLAVRKLAVKRRS